MALVNFGRDFSIHVEIDDEASTDDLRRAMRAEANRWIEAEIEDWGLQQEQDRPKIPSRRPTRAASLERSAQAPK